jgi:hypothetical protein
MTPATESMVLGTLVRAPQVPVTAVSPPERLSRPGPKKETARIPVPVNDKPWTPSPLLE